MPADLTPQQREQLAQAVSAGRKIEAIKELRDWTGLGLKDAKDIIDHMEKELRASHPERFAPRQPANKLTVVFALLLFVVVTALAIYFLRH